MATCVKFVVDNGRLIGVQGEDNLVLCVVNGRLGYFTPEQRAAEVAHQAAKSSTDDE